MKKEKNLPIVGSKITVDFPELSLSGIPAKVDTGADSSSIWASNIVEDNEVLSFTLFDESSSHYTGQRLFFDKFTVSKIKNSFGASEYRYKIALQLSIKGKTINTRFTLSDRKDNKFPILIGSQTLKNHFLVDVSKVSLRKSYKILMISTRKTSVTETFAKNLTTHGKKLDVTYIAYEDLVFITGNKNEIKLLGSNQNITNFDLVHFKTTAKYQDIAAATARYLAKRRVPFMDTAIMHFPASSKLYQYIILADDSFKIPKSVFLFPSKLVDSYQFLVDSLALPFVLKDIHGNKGEHNYVVKDEKSFNRACKEANKDNVQLIAQAFIPNECDYRLLVFGARIPLVIKRARISKNTHLNNTSQGAPATIVPLETVPPELQRASIRAAKTLDREVAGVDLVQDKNTGLWYCFEVNDGPQIASGSFTAEKNLAFAEFLRRKVEN